MGYILTEKDGGVATLTINRPVELNALNSEVLADLDAAWDGVAADEDVRVVIITGAGRAFVAGADVAEMAELDLVGAREFGHKGQQLFRKIEKSEKPTIAAVNGFALGGGMELAMACDMRIASEYAVFGQPETGLGIIPGFSGTQRLPRLIGKAKATELILTSENIKADEALRIGLVNSVVKADELMTAAHALAGKIAAKAPMAVKWANSAIKRGLETDIDSGIAIEADLFAMCFTTEEQKAAMRKFLADLEAKMQAQKAQK